MALHFIERCAVEDEGEGPCGRLRARAGRQLQHLHAADAGAGAPPRGAHRPARQRPLAPRRGRRCRSARYVDAGAVGLRAAQRDARALSSATRWATSCCSTWRWPHPKLVRSLALFGPLIAPPDAARTSDPCARREGAQRGRQPACRRSRMALLNASISADTRARLPLAVAFVRESLMRQDPDGYARSCYALADAPAAAVEQIEAPVLLVTGDEDVVAPPQAVRAMAEKLHRAQLACASWCCPLRPLDTGRAARGVRARAARVSWRRSGDGACSHCARVWAKPRAGMRAALRLWRSAAACRLRCDARCRGRAAKLASLASLVALEQSRRVRCTKRAARADPEPCASRRRHMSLRAPPTHGFAEHRGSLDDDHGALRGTSPAARDVWRSERARRVQRSMPATRSSLAKPVGAQGCGTCRPGSALRRRAAQRSEAQSAALAADRREVSWAGTFSHGAGGIAAALESEQRREPGAQRPRMSRNWSGGPARPQPCSLGRQRSAHDRSN